MNLYERETTMTGTDGHDKVYIYSCRRKDISALKRRGVTVTEEGVYADGTVYAFMEVPSELVNFALAVRFRRTFSDEQRAVMADRARKYFGHSSSITVQEVE